MNIFIFTGAFLWFVGGFIELFEGNIRMAIISWAYAIAQVALAIR